MGVKAGSFTPASLGDLSVDGLTFLPDEIQFSLGAQTGTPSTIYSMMCRGWTTATNQSYDYFYADGSHFRCEANTNKCIRLYRWNTTTSSWEELVAATFVDFHTNVAGSDYGFKLNFTAVNASWQVRYKARG